MSEALKEFYAAYAEWLDAGAPEYNPFVRKTGLCWNIFNMPFTYDELKEACSEMKRQFKAAGLDVSYPFDTPMGYSMCNEMHLNEARISWVKTHLEDTL